MRLEKPLHLGGERNCQWCSGCYYDHISVVIAVLFFFFFLHSCTFFSSSYLCQWKPSYSRLIEQCKKIPTTTACVEAKQTTHVVCLVRVLVIYLDLNCIKLHEHARWRAATFEFSTIVVDFNLARPPLLYRVLRKLPRAITNARWTSSRLLLRPTSSFKYVADIDYKRVKWRS